MKVVIRGSNLPGRTCGENHNVHVGLQLRREPAELVPADADSAEWTVDVSVILGVDGEPDFRGPVVQGRRGERFIYLTWGAVDEAGGFDMFRRAKLDLTRVEPELVESAESGDRPLVATIDLTGSDGGPRCARVDPPALVWSLGR